MAVRRQRRGHPAGVILMYHRIGEAGPDPWQLAVTPEHFTEHLAVLRQLARPVSLGQLVSETFDNRLVDRTVALTFDDGYADNLWAAAPRLAAADIPATIYVTTGSTGTSDEFWWDELERLLLLPEKLPAELRLRVKAKERTWALGSATQGAWSSARPATPARVLFHREVWAELRALAFEDRRSALAELKSWSVSQQAPRPSHRVMTADELNTIEEDGLVEIGGHTVTHPFLPDLEQSEQRREMASSVASLEAILGHPIRSFSYPFGGATADTVRLATELGVDNAVGVQEQTVWHQSDRFLLPRFAVRDWTGDEFERRLRHWFVWHASR